MGRRLWLCVALWSLGTTIMAVGTRAEAGPWRLTGRLQWSDYEHHGSFGHFSFFSELELSGDFGADVWAEE